MDLESANELKPGQVLWFLPMGDAHEVAGPCLVLESPIVHCSLDYKYDIMTWIEVIVLTPRTVLDARNEELFLQDPSCKLS